MRAADIMECAALGLTGAEAVALSSKGSTQVFEAHKDGELLAVWGYREDSVITNSVSAWMFSYEAADDHKVYFARESRRLLKWLMWQYASVTVEVHARYGDACKWLTWLGFETLAVKLYNSEVFYVMRKDR